MATNEILQFANTASGAEILSQAAYAADPDRPDGHDPGTIARAELENKVLLQTSTIASMLAQFMADAQANNITDATAIATLAGYLKTAIKNVSILSCVAAGTANAITAAFTPATTTLADGKFLIIRASAANSSATPTLAVDGLTAKTIVKGSNAPLVNGDIAGAGFWMLITYDAMLDKYVLNNPAVASGGSGGSLGYFHMREEYANNTSAGTFTANTPTIRNLNTIVTNTITGASSPINGVMTLPAGTYKIFATSPGYGVNGHKAWLYEYAGSYSNFLLLGTTENTTTADSTRSIINGFLTLAVTTSVSIVHVCKTSKSTNGKGAAANVGFNEIYAEIFIEQIA